MISLVRPQPCFAVGQLVRHRTYGYRGVVVERDSHCRAPEEWYQSNATQPDRHQPWYHVLVHSTATSTYAAQSNLEPDNVTDPVDHPLVDEFFDAFEDGRYRRNDRTFGGWSDPS